MLVGVGVAVGVGSWVTVLVGVPEVSIVKKIAVGGPHAPLPSNDSTKSVC